MKSLGKYIEDIRNNIVFQKTNKLALLCQKCLLSWKVIRL